MDKIIIKGLKVFAYHGVNIEEKEQGQNFEVDVTIHLSLETPGKSDNINDTISYSKVCKTIIRVMNEKSYDLLEKVAMRIIEQLFMDYPLINSLDVTLKKPEAPIKTDFDYMAVQISRDRK